MTILKKNLGLFFIFILLIIEPFLELNFFYQGFEIMGLQLNTLIRLILFGGLSLVMLFNFKELKFKKSVIIYLTIVLAYVMAHHYNSFNFKSYIPDNLISYSLVGELFYIIRLLIPLFLIYYVYNLHLKDKNIQRSVIIGVGFVVLLMIISNIFKFAICSYNDDIIKGNIIDWFLHPMIGYSYLASRGLFSKIIVFYYVILFLPYLVYLFFKKEGKLGVFYGFLVALGVLAGFMGGTKATTLGVILVLAVSLILVIFFTWIKKEIKLQISKILVIIILIMGSFLLIPYSPMTNRNVTDSNAIKDQEAALKEENYNEQNVLVDDANKYLNEEGLDDILDKEDVLVDELLGSIDSDYSKEKILVNILKENINNYGITPFLIEDSYPYQYDPYFWKNFIDNTPFSLRSNNRLVEQEIFERILEVNNNEYDKWLGITYMRTSKVFNLERDFLYQYYSLGIFGVILFLMPFVLVVLTAGLIMLIKYKDKMTFLNCSLLLGIGLILCLAFYSGNTIDFLCVSMPLGIWCGLLLKNVFQKNKEVTK